MIIAEKVGNPIRLFLTILFVVTVLLSFQCKLILISREYILFRMKNPVIYTKLGKVRGKVASDYLGGKYYSFQGIPYARAPVGNLRFKAPQPPEPWTTELNATKEGPACPSMHIFFMQFTGKEDNCLNLNVYTRELSTNSTLNPVMVWIHGGGFITGSNSTELYNPKFLMTENVVQVTINYRLGIFGFLCLEDESLGVMGNAGLKDQVMALQWVKDNISYFGGDPNNVTVYGQSAGGASVHYLMLSLKAKGLFHKSIIQSGSIFSPWAHGQRGAKDIMKCLGVKDDDEKKILDILQKMSSRKLINAQGKLPELMLASQCRSFGPVIEKPSKEAFLSEDPLILLESGNYNSVPMIIGATSNEGMFYDMLRKLRNIKLDFDCEMEVPFDLDIIPKTKSCELLVKKINEFYKLDEDPHSERKCELKSDNLFIHGIHRTVNHHLKSNNNPIYYYTFSFNGDLNYTKHFSTVKSPRIYVTCCYLSTFFKNDAMKNAFRKIAKNISHRNIAGSSHADDLGYIFATVISMHIRPDSREQKMIKRMVNLWTNFAKYGDPTARQLKNDAGIYWRPVDQKNHHFLDIGDELVMKTNPFEARNKFWDEIYENCETKI